MTNKISPIPSELLLQIVELERKRLGMTEAEVLDQFANAFTGYIPDYSTDSPGFVGEVALAIWPAAPFAVTIWYRGRFTNDKWEFLYQSEW